MFRKNHRIYFSVLMCLLSLMVILPSHLKAEKKNIRPKPSVYIVKEGDTLWSISKDFFNDPFHWPSLWKNNKYILDPQWIYPGQPLLLKEKLVRSQIKTISKKITSPPSLPKPTIKPKTEPAKPEVPKPDFITNQDRIDSCGYILPEKIFLYREKQEKWGAIIDAKENKISYSFLDLLYINKGKKEISPQDLFTVFRPAKKVYHPISNKKMGYLINILGIVQVEKVLDQIALVKVLQSFSEIHLQDRIMPYKKIPIPTRSNPKEKIQGVLAATEDGRINLAENNIVFLDQGKNQHIEAGNHFLIYRQDLIFEERKNTVNNVIGELLILKTEENTSTALITKSKDIILVGNQFSSHL